MDESFTDKIKESRRLLENPYAYLVWECSYEAVHNQSVDEEVSFVLSAEEIRAIKPKRKKQHLSNDEIEKVVTKLQAAIWNQLKGSLGNPIKLLDPSIIFKTIGYDY